MKWSRPARGLAYTVGVSGLQIVDLVADYEREDLGLIGKVVDHRLERYRASRTHTLVDENVAAMLGEY